MPPRDRHPLVQPGNICVSDANGALEHVVQHPAEDEELQRVLSWLQERPLEQLFTTAVDQAVQYVLDGARTWRFDLNSTEVDSDERASVGTKLQYHVIAALGLIKEKPLDTTIADIAVELKGTVRTNWMIPREGQCQICMLFQVDAANDRHRAFLMRTHRVWLNRGNQDMKRSIRQDALNTYAVPLLDWTPLPRNPLKMLTAEQHAVVFDLHKGQATRLTALFGFLPDVVIPRISILTVCANKQDPMRRTRQIKAKVRAEHGLELLCGTWQADRDAAAAWGFLLPDESWVALRSPEAPGDDAAAAPVSDVLF
ncbi:NaeI family type II restriction endonuclease [Nocardia asteroides]|uniref:NaeI family type II restriction endonuclease n=1 Tax=Nocardia asteroides TaxID=1824 RepID=UPI001E28EBC2|nr:NaeI family type II restriction endonuclease [Nocardia asteroides]UGT63782.1 hypothetical protein LTT61_10950 [Nocardia asteroides]